MADQSENQRVIVITGAASGIGYASAELFRDAGDLVFGLDIAGSVPEGVTYVQCNVADKRSVDAAIGSCAGQGRIDVLANVAGGVQFGRVDQITEADWDRVHAIDLKGPFLMMQAAMPYLRACRGNIVNVSSVAGNKPQGYTTAYSAAKGGLTMLTRSLALELAPERIRVNAICPGTVDTPIVSQVAEIYPDDLDPRVAPPPPAARRRAGGGRCAGGRRAPPPPPRRDRLGHRLPGVARGADDHR